MIEIKIQLAYCLLFLAGTLTAFVGACLGLMWVISAGMILNILGCFMRLYGIYTLRKNK